MTETPVPLGWMRSVYALQAGFALESFIDELALAAGKDPLKYRLQLLAKGSGSPILHDYLAHSPHARVLQFAAEKQAGASRFPPATTEDRLLRLLPDVYGGGGRDHDGGYSTQGAPRGRRVDCGQVVNPAILEQQIQGGVVYGLSNALRAQITIDKGRVVQGNFDDYAPLRMDETPAVEVYAVPSQEPPTGIGEPSLPPVAPRCATRSTPRRRSESEHCQFKAEKDP